MCVLLQVEVTERTNKNWKDSKTAVWEVNDDELGLEHVLLNMPSGHTAAGEKADRSIVSLLVHYGHLCEPELTGRR